MFNVTAPPQKRTVQQLVDVGVYIVQGTSYHTAEHWRRRVDTVYVCVVDANNERDYIRIGSVVTRTNVQWGATDFTTFSNNTQFFTDGVNVDWLLGTALPELLYQ